MIRGYRYKLRPSAAQIAQLEAALEIQRGLYNDALRERKELLEQENAHTSFYKQNPNIPQIRAIRPEVAALPYCMSSGTYKRLDEAWKAFRKRWKKGVHPDNAGMPRYLRYGENNTLTYYGRMGSGWDYMPPVSNAKEGERRNAAVRLNPFGVIRTVKDRPIPTEAFTGKPSKSDNYGGRDGYRIATICEVTRDVRGWWVSLIVEQDTGDPPPFTGKVLGIDLGISHFLTTSDGRHFDLPRYAPDAPRCVAVYQRRLERRRESSRQQGMAVVAEIERNGSLSEEERDRQVRRAKRLRTVGYEDTRRGKARIEKHVADSRKHWHIETAHRLLDGMNPGDAIAYECLDIKSMVKKPDAMPDAESMGFHKNGARRSARISKAILGAGWSQFLLLLRHEAAEVGVSVVGVDASGTSQECSACGESVPKDLSNRVHACPHCRYVADRDINAARNIASRGLKNIAGMISHE